MNRRLEAALSPLPGHPHDLVRHSLLSSVSSSSVFAKGMIEMSLGQVNVISHLWLLKYLHTREVRYSRGPSDVLAWSLLSLSHLLVRFVFHSEFRGV